MYRLWKTFLKTMGGSITGVLQVFFFNLDLFYKVLDKQAIAY